MSHRTEHPTKCEQCSRTVPSSKWDYVRAGDAGWFFQRDGRAYCPDHVPAWVESWRARRDA